MASMAKPEPPTNQMRGGAHPLNRTWQDMDLMTDIIGEQDTALQHIYSQLFCSRVGQLSRYLYYFHLVVSLIKLSQPSRHILYNILILCMGILPPNLFLEWWKKHEKTLPIELIL